MTDEERNTQETAKLMEDLLGYVQDREAVWSAAVFEACDAEVRVAAKIEAGIAINLTDNLMLVSLVAYEKFGGEFLSDGMPRDLRVFWHVYFRLLSIVTQDQRESTLRYVLNKSADAMAEAKAAPKPLAPEDDAA